MRALTLICLFLVVASAFGQSGMEHTERASVKYPEWPGAWSHWRSYAALIEPWPEKIHDPQSAEKFRTMIEIEWRQGTDPSTMPGGSPFKVTQWRVINYLDIPIYNVQIEGLQFEYIQNDKLEEKHSFNVIEKIEPYGTSPGQKTSVRTNHAEISLLLEQPVLRFSLEPNGENRNWDEIWQGDRVVFRNQLNALHRSPTNPDVGFSDHYVGKVSPKIIYDIYLRYHTAWPMILAVSTRSVNGSDEDWELVTVCYGQQGEFKDSFDPDDFHYRFKLPQLKGLVRLTPFYYHPETREWYGCRIYGSPQILEQGTTRFNALDGSAHNDPVDLHVRLELHDDGKAESDLEKFFETYLPESDDPDIKSFFKLVARMLGITL